jgi:hypothetical protein
VARRQRRRLVEEEQFGVAAGRHRRAAPVPEIERAGDPGPVLPAAPAEAALAVVEDAAIAHQRATGGIGDDVARRRDAVLQRHRDVLFVGSASPHWRPPVARVSCNRIARGITE